MKKILLAASISCISLASLAQVAGGLKAGYNLSSMGGNKEGRGNVRPRSGFHFGVGVHIPIHRVLSVQPELLFSTGGANWDEIIELENSELVKLEITQKLTYLSMPVSMVYSIGRFNIQAGPQMNLLLAAGDDVEMTRISGGNIITVSGFARKSENLKKIDAGLNFGAGLDFGNVGISAWYYLGLTNLHDAEGFPNESKITNNVIQMSLMYTFSDQQM